jgi:hemerythrin superfamily protein
MASTRQARASTKARDEILNQLKADHRSVKKAYREFNKLDGGDDDEACAQIVQQVIAELSVHAAIEEELLYPAVRGVIADEGLIDEAEVEHETMHTLIEQLRGLEPDDEKYSARFTVLCEYVLHHVKEEEGEMFPQIERVRLDWDSLAAEVSARREELMAEAGIAGEADEAMGEEAAGAARAGREERSGGAAAQRR